VLVSFTVHETPHVKPRGRIFLRRIAGIGVFTWLDDDNLITFRNNTDDLRSEMFRSANSLCCHERGLFRLPVPFRIRII
jgi:hypothetical protein